MKSSRFGAIESSMEDRMKVRRGTKRALAVGLIVGSAWAMTACSSIERQETEDTEKLLAAAGFKMKMPESPAKLAQLQAMKQEKIVRYTKDGTLYFLYADAKDCGCLYVGNQTNYDAYQKLSVQREIAIADQEATMDAEASPDMDWGAWGYGNPGW